MSSDRVMLVVVVVLVPEGIAIVQLLMPITRSVFISELFMVFAAEGSVSHHTFSITAIISTLWTSLHLRWRQGGNLLGRFRLQAFKRRDVMRKFL